MLEVGKLYAGKEFRTNRPIKGTYYKDAEEFDSIVLIDKYEIHHLVTIDSFTEVEEVKDPVLYRFLINCKFVYFPDGDYAEKPNYAVCIKIEEDDIMEDAIVYQLKQLGFEDVRPASLSFTAQAID